MSNWPENMIKIKNNVCSPSCIQECICTCCVYVSQSLFSSCVAVVTVNYPPHQFVCAGAVWKGACGISVLKNESKGFGSAKKNKKCCIWNETKNPPTMIEPIWREHQLPSHPEHVAVVSAAELDSQRRVVHLLNALCFSGTSCLRKGMPHIA